MIKTIIILIIANSHHTSTYAYEEENRIDPPVEAPALPEKHLKVPEPPSGLPEDPKPGYKPEGEDLKTDATYWPFYRTYYPYYRYRYYRPRIYHRYYYW